MLYQRLKWQNILNMRNHFRIQQFKGLIEASIKGKILDWNEVLIFISNILEKGEFWVKEDWENYYNNFTYNISNLIFRGFESKEHSFDDALLPLTEKILLTLSNKVVSYSINTSVREILYSQKYMIYSAMISYSLRYSKYSVDGHSNLGWVKTIKDDFTNRLDKNFESSVEFSFTVGSHLESLLYLGNNWVVSNINLIFPQKEEQYWEAAMKGFLYKTASPPQVLYEILRDNGNYSKAIQHSFDKGEIIKIREITENLVFHICSKYLAKEESLENNNSLISQLLNYKNVGRPLIPD